MATARAIGIDLGTTYSCVGVFQNGKVEIIANEQGNRTTPSVVAFNDVERMIGEAAKNQAGLNAKNTIYNAKRLIGRSIDDPNIQEDVKHWPFTVIKKGGKLMVQATYKGQLKTFLPEVISSMVLENLKATAEAYLGSEVTDAVVTVPAYFNDQQRKATLDAGKIAGLKILRIVNEPSAAAFAYGLEKKVNSNILIFDLGGGTLDISVLSINKGLEFTVLATSGDTHLGGEDFDMKLAAFLAKEFQKKHGKDITHNVRAMGRLRTAAEKAKRSLSTCTTTTVDVESLFEGIDFSLRGSRARFEDMCSDLFLSTISHVEKALKDAKMDKASINEVVLSGGSTRIPKIQELLKNFFGGKVLNQSINSDEAVAYGATLQAAILSDCATDAIKDAVMFEVTPLSLGISVNKSSLMGVVIPRNTRIPCTQTEMFTNIADYQRIVTIKVGEGEEHLFKDNNFLGMVHLDGITPVPAATAKIDVTFDIDVNTILKVTAKERGTDKECNITIKRKCGVEMTAATLNKFVNEAKRFKKDDARQQSINEARADLENFVLQVNSFVPNLATDIGDKKGRILQCCADILVWLDTNPRPDPKECEAKQMMLTATLVSK